jgi:hypothetical protein
MGLDDGERRRFSLAAEGGRDPRVRLFDAPAREP